MTRVWPTTWDVNRAVLMVQSATVLFLYWEMTAAKRRMVGEYIGQDADALRVELALHDVTDIWFTGANSNWNRRIPTYPGARSWYIPGVPANRDFLVDVCVEPPSGGVLTLLRSNLVRTPPDHHAIPPHIPTVHFAHPLCQTTEDRLPTAQSKVQIFDGYSIREPLVQGVSM